MTMLWTTARQELRELRAHNKLMLQSLCFASADITTAILESGHHDDYWMGRVDAIQKNIDATLEAIRSKCTPRT